MALYATGFTLPPTSSQQVKSAKETPLSVLLPRSNGQNRPGIFSYIISSDYFGSMLSLLVVLNSLSPQLAAHGTSPTPVILEERDQF